MLVILNGVISTFNYTVTDGWVYKGKNEDQHFKILIYKNMLNINLNVFIYV